MKTLAIILIGFFVTFCSEQQGLLEQINRSGELRVVTRDSLSTCYRVGDGFAGFEYSLARRFADELGVRLKMILVENDHQALEAIRSGKGHLLAGIGIVPGQDPNAPWEPSGHSGEAGYLRFGPVYWKIRRQVVYRRGTKRPRCIRDLAGRLVEIAPGYGYTDMLRDLADKDPDLIWRERELPDTEALLSLVLGKKVDITIADSSEVSLLRQRYPELSPAFDIGEPQLLVWGMTTDAGDGLYLATRLFFEKMKKNGDLEDIIERHYGHMEHFDYVETHRFLRHTKARLPKYTEHFKTAAAKYNLDWRLLSAIGYQESHWDPDAVSPTGVRGIMMLTSDTAKQLGVVDRTDEKESIFGGARYFAQIKARLPEQVEEPDRTWFALAAYNVGPGHLEDVRVLARRAGANPDRWRDVSRFLPLISEKKWYTKTRYGYARGHEPVHFVRNVRRYYDRLVWLDSSHPLVAMKRKNR